MPADNALPRFDAALQDWPMAEESGGQWLLLYTSLGPLGGRMTCLRCGAAALQPDLIEHQPGCPYSTRNA